MNDDLPDPMHLFRGTLREMPHLLNQILTSYAEVYHDAFSVDTGDHLNVTGGDENDPTYNAYMAKRAKRADCRRATKQLRHMAKEMRALTALLAASARTQGFHDEDRESLTRTVAPVSAVDQHRTHVERENSLRTA